MIYALIPTLPRYCHPPIYENKLSCQEGNSFFLRSVNLPVSALKRLRVKQIWRIRTTSMPLFHFVDNNLQDTMPQVRIVGNRGAFLTITDCTTIKYDVPNESGPERKGSIHNLLPHPLRPAIASSFSQRKTGKRFAREQALQEEMQLGSLSPES